MLQRMSMEALLKALAEGTAPEEIDEHAKLEAIKKDPVKLRKQIALTTFEVDLAKAIIKFRDDSDGDEELVNEQVSHIGGIFADSDESDSPLDQAVRQLPKFEQLLAELAPIKAGSKSKQ